MSEAKTEEETVSKLANAVKISPSSENQIPNNEAAQQDENDDVVDPWNVVSKSDKGIDYDKLIGKKIHFIGEFFCIFTA